tara:strand:- start:5617 stop:5811 length:195 start_codon:yes stop_codon:yes gene_type:complete
MDLKIGNYASYLQVRKFEESMKPLKTKSLGEGIMVDYDKDGQIVGIEILTEVKPSYYSDYKEKK